MFFDLVSGVEQDTLRRPPLYVSVIDRDVAGDDVRSTRKAFLAAAPLRQIIPESLPPGMT